MLLSNTEAVNEYSDLDHEQPEEVLDICISVPILGYKNISLSVCEDGYIITNYPQERSFLQAKKTHKHLPIIFCGSAAVMRFYTRLIQMKLAYQNKGVSGNNDLCL